MNQEIPQNLDELKIEEGKEKLMELEKEGIYVFHGSPYLLQELEPRQARTFDKEEDEMVDDGEPGVAASPFAEIAIFRAIITRDLKDKDKKHYSGFGGGGSGERDKVTYRTTPEIFKKTKETSGYVYVFKKEDFVERSGIEWKSSNRVEPVKIFKVYFEDLPKDVLLLGVDDFKSWLKNNARRLRD